jgi:hypothetical protein
VEQQFPGRTLTYELFVPWQGTRNNLAERTIGQLVLLRNVIHHFKNAMGAAFADRIWRVGLTAVYNGVNVYEYFKLILAGGDAVKQSPEDWLPWNLSERMPQILLPDKGKFNPRQLPKLDG